jgi:hypothetical protein
MRRATADFAATRFVRRDEEAGFGRLAALGFAMDVLVFTGG